MLSIKIVFTSDYSPIDGINIISILLDMVSITETPPKDLLLSTCHVPEFLSHISVRG